MKCYICKVDVSIKESIILMHRICTAKLVSAQSTILFDVKIKIYFTLHRLSDTQNKSLQDQGK